MIPHEWLETKFVLPEIGVIVETKIEDAEGAREHRLLKRGGYNGDLWFHWDCMLFVLTPPTHWRPTMW